MFTAFLENDILYIGILLYLRWWHLPVSDLRCTGSQRSQVLRKVQAEGAAQCVRYSVEQALAVIMVVLPAGCRQAGPPQGTRDIGYEDVLLHRSI